MQGNHDKVPKHTQILKKACDAEKISSSDCVLLKAFISEVSSQQGISGIGDDRKAILVIAAITLRGYLNGSYENVSTEDVLFAIDEYKGDTKHSKGTQKLYLSAFKQFLTWLRETDKNQHLQTNRISKINTNIKTVLKSEKDVLIGDELERVFRAMRSFRDRTFIEVLYESMGRIGEVCSLTWKQVEFFNDHAIITIQSKTEFQRKIPLYISHITLKNWQYQYPQGAEPDAYVFYGRISNRFKPMNYGTALRLVTQAAQDAGIEKHVTPHTFRHTRITDLLRMGIPEQTIKMLAWGNVTSEMLKVYAHLTPTDAVNDLNKRMGVDAGNKMEPLADIATPAQCPQCGTINSKLNPYCGNCGSEMARYIHT